MTKGKIFSEWAREWLIAYKKGAVKVSTYTETYERTVESYLIPWFGDYGLDGIKPVDVRKFFNVHAEYSLSTVKKMRLCLNGIFNTAVENDLCGKNPAANVKPGSNYHSKPKETYSVEEVTALLRKTDAHKYGIYVRILLELGLRCSELCGLMWSDFDFERKTLSIKRACTAVKSKAFVASPKNESSARTLPVSSALCRRLLKHRSESKSQYVIVSARSCSPITPRNFTRTYYDRFFEDMRIEKVLTPHECRHTCGTLMYEQTHDIYAVSKFLGHSSINITSQLYVHEDPEMLRKALKIK